MIRKLLKTKHSVLRNLPILLQFSEILLHGFLFLKTIFVHFFNSVFLVYLIYFDFKRCWFLRFEIFSFSFLFCKDFVLFLSYLVHFILFQNYARRVFFCWIFLKFSSKIFCSSLALIIMLFSANRPLWTNCSAIRRTALAVTRRHSLCYMRFISSRKTTATKWSFSATRTLLRNA